MPNLKRLLIFMTSENLDGIAYLIFEVFSVTTLNLWHVCFHRIMKIMSCVEF